MIYRIFLAALFMLICISSAFAQVGGKEKVLRGKKPYSKAPFSDINGFTANFGVKLGYGFNNAIIENHSSTSSGLTGQSGFSGGLFVHFSHVDYIRFQTEAIYIRKGFKRSTYEAQLDYLSFPIMVRAQIPLNIFFNFGFAVSYLMNGTVSDQTDASTKIDDYFERIGYDLQAGLGWEFEIFDGGNLFLELRFTYDLKNISKRYPETVHLYTTYLYAGFQY